MKNGFFRNLVLLIILLFVYKVQAQELKSVNFIQEGEISKLILDFSEPVFAERKHIAKDKQILLDIQNVKRIPKKLLRGIDTSEFSGASVYVSPYLKPGTTNELRFAIQLRDNVRSILDKKGNRVTLHIENRFGVFAKAKIDEAEGIVSKSLSELNGKISAPKSASVLDILENITQSGTKKYLGRKISISVNNVSYKELLRMIADTSGFNVIIDDLVDKRPPLTLSLTNVPWDQALDTVLNLGKLVAEKHANILTIITDEKARANQQLAMDLKKKSVIQEPLVTKIFPVSFAEIEDLQKIITDYSTKDRGTIKIDKRTNNLIVQDTVDNIERMKKIIETLDTETPQILIESKVVEAIDKHQLQIGMGLTSGGLERKGGLAFGYTPFGNNGTSAGQFAFSSAPTIESPTFLRGTISVFKKLTDLEFNLDLMEQESKIKIVSSPKIVTQNNEEASIINKETTSFRVVQQQNGIAVTTFQQISADIELKVTPRVTNDGSIIMAVDLKKEGFGDTPIEDAPPNMSSRQVKTNVLVDNGSTVVVGGLYITNKSKSESGIPVLKDLPLVGWLFRTAYNPLEERSELIVFMTPRIINQEEAGLISRSDDAVEK